MGLGIKLEYIAYDRHAMTRLSLLLWLVVDLHHCLHVNMDIVPRDVDAEPVSEVAPIILQCIRDGVPPATVRAAVASQVHGSLPSQSLYIYMV